ncbi:MAG: hypothetical protein ACXAC5_22700 [Promethearchaeota archaeon]
MNLLILLGIISLLIPSIVVMSISSNINDIPNSEINPIIEYSTFVGGNDSEIGRSILVDSADNPILIGHTKSSDFPVTNGLFPSGGQDIYVTKFNGNELSEILFSTVLGGTEDEVFEYATIDAEDNIFLVGSTASADFPVSSTAYSQAYNGGNSDGYIMKIAPNGTLLFATYFGGSNEDHLLGLDVDSQGNLWVVGNSLSANFPTTSESYDESYNGGTVTDKGFVTRTGGDGIFSKFSVNGSVLLYSSYLGASDNDLLWRVKADTSDTIYLLGLTKSTDFPTTSNAWSTTHRGERDISVSKFTINDSSMLYSTLIGGGWDDESFDFWVDTDGSVLLCGWTESGTFPLSKNAVDTARSGTTECIALRLSPDGSDLLFSTYVGGDQHWAFDAWEAFTDVTVDQDTSDVYFAGFTTNTNYPTTDGSKYSGGYYDIVITVFSKSGSRIRFSTVIGGSEIEKESQIAVISSKTIFLCSYTSSSDFPVTNDALNASYNGAGDAVFMKIVFPDSWPSQGGITGFELGILFLVLSLCVIYARKRRR